MAFLENEKFKRSFSNSIKKIKYGGFQLSSSKNNNFSLFTILIKDRAQARFFIEKRISKE